MYAGHLLVVLVVRRAHDKGILRIALDVAMISSTPRAWHPARVRGSCCSVGCGFFTSLLTAPESCTLGLALAWGHCWLVLRVMLPLSLTSPALTLCDS